MQIVVQPIAMVSNSRTTAIDDHWSEIISTIELAEHIPTAAFNNIEAFSHPDIIYYFHKVKDDAIVYSGHPGENESYPLMGIFAQRKKNRPNKIGVCTVELLEHTRRSIKVRNLDAIDGTPVLDIKPVFREFQPVGTIKQPAWVTDLMKAYWK